MENISNNKKTINFDRKKSIFLGSIAIASLALVIIVALIVLSNRGYRSIQVNKIEGTASVSRDKTQVKGYESMLLRTGDKISTNSTSSVQLKLDDSKYVLMDSDSIVGIECSGSKSSNRMKLVLEKGILSNVISKPLEETSTYEVLTPNMTMSVRGTKFRVSLETIGNVQVVDTAVTEGKVLATTFYYDANGDYVVDEEVMITHGNGYLVIITKIDEGVYSFEKHLYSLPYGYTIGTDKASSNILPVPAGLIPAKYLDKLTTITSNDKQTAATTPTPVPSKEPTPVPTSTNTPVPTVTNTPVPTATPMPTATATPAPTATPKPTATATPAPTSTPKPTATSTPVPTNTPTPSARPLSVSISVETTWGKDKGSDGTLTFTNIGNKEIELKYIKFPSIDYKIETAVLNSQNASGVDVSKFGAPTCRKDGDYYVITFGANTKFAPGASFEIKIHGDLRKTLSVGAQIPVSFLYGGLLYEYSLENKKN